VANDVAAVLDAGDLVWVEFGPPFGHEQAGRRPALVVSPRSYNEISSLIVVCPITRTASTWGFKIDFPPVGRIEGAVVVDQIRAIDPRARFARRAGEVGADTLAAVRGMLASLLRIPVPI
jgi:mRNA interferase MazF